MSSNYYLISIWHTIFFSLVLKVAHRGYVMENGRITLSDFADRLLENEDVKRAYLGL